jgi:2-polyprenyl-6-methoxyphenol hydroxylase-like FAD-dependent oxidoreductase
MNYALSQRGVKVFEKLGVMEDIKSKSMPYTGTSIHAPDGTVHDYPNPNNDVTNYFVRR